MAKLQYVGNKTEIMSDLETIALVLKAAGIKSFTREDAENILTSTFNGEERSVTFGGKLLLETKAAKNGEQTYRLTLRLEEDDYVKGNKWIRNGIRLARPLISGIAALIKGFKDTVAVGGKLSKWLDEMPEGNSQPEPDEPKSSEPAVTASHKVATAPKYAVITANFNTALMRLDHDANDYVMVRSTISIGDDGYEDWLKAVESTAYGKTGIWKTMPEKQALHEYEERVKATPKVKPVAKTVARRFNML